MPGWQHRNRQAGVPLGPELRSSPAPTRHGTSSRRAIESSRAFAERWRERLPTHERGRAGRRPGRAGRDRQPALADLLLRRAAQSVDVTDEENRDFSAAVEQGMVEAINHLRFFELEWLALPEERARQLAGSARGRGRSPPPDLAAPLRPAHAQRAGGARAGRARRRRGERLADAVRSDHVHHRGAVRRRRRRAAAHASTGCWPTCTTSAATCASGALDTLYAALEPRAEVLAHCYDSLVGDRLVIDRLRSYGDDPMRQHAPAQRARRRRGDAHAGRRRRAATASPSAGSGPRP